MKTTESADITNIPESPEPECCCGYEWGQHSSWCPMSAVVIRDLEPRDYDGEDDYHARRFMAAEDLYHGDD